MSAGSYNIIGTGALGGYYGARLHHAGFDVRFLLHSDHEYVLANGLRVESVDGDFSIAEPQAYGCVSDLPQADVAVVCLKSTANSVLPELLPPAVRPGGRVLIMQNGLGVEEDVASILPDHTILGGLAFLCSNKVGPGHVRHLDYGQVRFAEYRADGSPAGLTGAVREIAGDFETAGIPVALESDLLLARWKKLVWNITYNGLCVLNRCTTDVLMANPQMRALCEAVMNEVVSAAAACGRVISASFVPMMLETTEAMSAYKPSMLLDYERGNPLEIEAIYGTPLRRAKEAGCSCPLIEDIYEQLKAIAG